MSQQHPQQHNNIYRQNITSFCLEKIYQHIIHLHTPRPCGSPLTANTWGTPWKAKKVITFHFLGVKQPVRVTCVCLKCLGKRGILDYNFQRLGRSMDYCWLRSHYNSKSLSRCPRIWPLFFVKLSRLDWGQSILPRCQVVWTGASQSYRYFKAWLVLVKLTDLSSRLDWGQSTLPGLGPVKITEMSRLD